MPTTFGDLKTAIRLNLFPTGESPNLVASHNKMFVDALIDLQSVVPCLQQDNTDLFPQCSTYYDCQLTVFPAPRGSIKSVSVIDKIDETTHQESTTADDDYCARIFYNQVDPCHMRAWKHRGGMRGCGCGSVPLFFGLPCDLWGTGGFPFPPTDVGVPAGLPALPMGFHYPQTSTDRVTADGARRWRARAGVWAIERGKIWIAPWIQSTETVIVVWDGIKRSWGDDDQVDDDPLLSQAIEDYVRWKHADKYDKDEAEAARAAGSYALAKEALIHQCREETRVRECEPSHARSSVPSLTSLFYNESQTASGTCPDGSNPTSVTIPAGSVSSTVSVADANQRAYNEAQSQLTARLDSLCSGQGATYTNTAQTATVSCTTEAGAPPPDGAPVTVTVPAGTVTSTISQADADAQALALAQLQAGNQLRCIYWNKEATVTLICAGNPAITVTKTVAAHTYSSVVSQDTADQLAIDDATNQANAQLAIVCPATTLYWNTLQQVGVNIFCPGSHVNREIVTCVVPAHTFSGATLAQANNRAQQRGNQYAATVAYQRCQQGIYGSVTVFYPV